jgi:Sec-independent protein translocase protein TatA
MLAFFSNLSPGEVIVVLIAAVLIFGRRLPEVAAKGAVQLQKLRRGVTDFKRESGFDEEIRRARRLIDNPLKEAAKELTKEPASWRPPSPRIAPHPEGVPAKKEEEGDIGAELVNTPAKTPASETPSSKAEAELPKPAADTTD